MLQNDILLAAIEAELEQAAGLDQRRRQMLKYCRKLTQLPDQMSRNDVENLREVGFQDRDILHIVEVTAYYAYVNRIADGLGVELETEAE